MIKKLGYTIFIIYLFAFIGFSQGVDPGITKKINKTSTPKPTKPVAKPSVSKTTTSTRKTSKPNPTSANKSTKKTVGINPIEVEREFWEAIKKSNDVGDFNLYKEKYPNGNYTALADLKIRQLTKKSPTTQPNNSNSTISVKSNPATPSKQNGTVPTNANGDLPSDADIEAIVQETLLDFAQGVSDSYFTDMYEKSAKGFKRTYTVDSVKTNFIAFINQKDRVVPLLRSTASMTPTYTSKPSVSNVRGNRTLTVNGSYATSTTTNFELQYWLEDKRWRMIAIRIRIQ